MRENDFILEVENFKSDINELSNAPENNIKAAENLADALVDATSITERLKLLDEFTFDCNGRDMNTLDPEVLDGIVKDGCGTSGRDRLLAYILFEMCGALQTDLLFRGLSGCMRDHERLKLKYMF